MLNGLRGFVRWLDAVLNADHTRVMAEEAYEQMFEEMEQKAAACKERKEAKEKNSAFLQNLLLTTLPEVIKTFSGASKPPAVRIGTPPTMGIEMDRPVTIHRPRPAVDDTQAPEQAKDAGLKSFNQEASLASLEERVRVLELLLDERPCVVGAAREAGIDLGTKVHVLRPEEFPAWIRQIIDDMRKQQQTNPCTPKSAEPAVKPATTPAESIESHD